MGICSGSDMYGDARYGDLDPHTVCQQVKQWPPAWASAAWAREQLPQLPRGVLFQVDTAVARGQRPMCQKIVESLDHTHSTHRCCRSCLEPREGLAMRGRIRATAAVPASISLSLSPQLPGRPASYRSPGQSKASCSSPGNAL
eukprot:364792-Chlamydomonas_euryale.AAC.10